jgi:uncharacterized protein (DUF433 family)
MKRKGGIVRPMYAGEESDQHAETDPHHPRSRSHGGKPCIRGLRVTVGTVVGLVAAGHTDAEILRECPYLEPADIREALAYAAWRAEEVEVPLAHP